MKIKFEREKHVYKSDAFEKLIKDTIRFFNGTPVHELPPPERFHGTGVYAIYYTGRNEYYNKLYELNRIEYSLPIYVGKAVPRGWRQAKSASSNTNSFELFSRIKEHGRSISQVDNLELVDFSCRFMILEDNASHLIATVEAALIRHYKPIWNTQIDGFGNHDPGSGRYNQAKSDWDVLHIGRPWAEKCKGDAALLKEVRKKVSGYFKNLDNESK